MTKQRWLANLLLLVVAILVPTIFKTPYLVHLFVLSGIFALFSLAYDIVIGMMGQFSFGHQALWGLGAYISALLAVDTGVSPWFTIPAGAIGTGIFGFAMGWISLRLRGAYLGIITLGFAVILQEVIINWKTVTHGWLQVLRIPAPKLGDTALNTPFSYYYLVLAFLLLTIYFIKSIQRSRFGRGLAALRENEQRAISLGIPIFKYMVVAFTISATLSGLAGALFAHYVHTINPNTLATSYLWAALIIVLVGGSGTLGGPLIGTLLFIFVPEWLRMAAALRFAVFGILIVVCVVFVPEGLYPRLLSLWNRFIVSRVKG